MQGAAVPLDGVFQSRWLLEYERFGLRQRSTPGSGLSVVVSSVAFLGAAANRAGEWLLSVSLKSVLRRCRRKTSGFVC